MKKSLKSLFVISLFLLVSCNNNSTSEMNFSNDRNISSELSSNSNIGLGEKEYRVRVLYPNGDACYDAYLFAQWCSDTTCYLPVKFDKDGYATTTIKNDDGNTDYYVHLGNIPEGYTYNANKYITNGKNKDIVIVLSSLSEFISGDGTKNSDSNDATKGPYIVNAFVYNFNVTSKDDEVYFGFKAFSTGKYLIESWSYDTSGVDTEIFYYGNDILNISSVPINSFSTGGLNGNFSFEFEVDSIEQTYVFSVKAKGDRIYPFTFPISISEVK